MNQERILKIIQSPVISEKAAVGADAMNQHVFKVAADASKLNQESGRDLLQGQGRQCAHSEYEGQK
jgi:stage V sporulation protein SpoVS